MQRPMEMPWLRRLRWRMRGAWLWPTFVAITVVDAEVMHRLPLQGDTAVFFGSLLMAGFLNLVAVAVAAPFVARMLRRRRPDLPKVVAENYAGTALVLAIAVAIVGAGLLHHPAIREGQDKFRAQGLQAVHYIARSAPRAYARNVGRADTLKLGPDLYRTCVPGPNPRRAFCVYVHTDQSPPGIVRDTNGAPNAISGLRGWGD